MEEATEKEDVELVVSSKKIYADKKKPCPWCNGMTLEEMVLAYESVVYCTHCSYSDTKTI